MIIDLKRADPTCWGVCWACLVVLEAFERAGREDTEAADEVRGQGTAAWRGLSDDEREELRCLSVHLRERRP